MDETDLLQYQKSTDEATILEQYATRAPAFDLWDKSFFIYSGEAIAAVTNGLKLWAIIYPADFTDLTSTDDMSLNPSTVSHGFPREFHRLLAVAVSRDYKQSQTRPVPLLTQEQSLDKDFEEKINSLKDSNEDRNYIVAIPYNDGSQY